MVGKPQTVSLQAGNEVYLWYFTDVDSKAANFVPFGALIAGGYDMHMQQLLVEFDERERVVNYTFNDTDQEVKSGIF